MTYRPDPAFTRLYDLYTGPGSLADELARRRAAALADAPLLVSTGTDLVLFPGGGAAPIWESFRHSTRGFRELTAVSHLGTAVAWLAEMAEHGLPWQDRAREVVAQCAEVRRVSSAAHVRGIGVEAWAGREAEIADLIDYACRVTGAFLEDTLREPDALTHARVRDRYLEPVDGSLPLPFNDVMVATFALTFLDIAFRIIRWVRARDIDWERAMALIAGVSGRPTAGLTWETNNMCHKLWRASDGRLARDHLLIGAGLPGIDLSEMTAGADLSDREARYRMLWCRLRVTAEIGAKMFDGFPAFAPSPARPPVLEAGTETVAAMPALRDPFDRVTAITRLRMVMEDPTQLLSNAVSDFIIDELCLYGLDPTRVRIPGLAHAPPSLGGRAGSGQTVT